MRYFLSLMLMLCTVGCDAGELRMGYSTYSYRANVPDWQFEAPRMSRVRAAHTLLALGDDEFLVVGGDSPVEHTLPNAVVGDLQLNLDVERCSLGQAAQDYCTVVMSLARGVERPQVAALPDSRIAVSDGRSIQLLDLDTSRVAELDVAARNLVATPAGVAVLGIVGPKLPGNLPGPRQYGVLRDGQRELVMIEPPPPGVALQTSCALDATHVLVASANGSAVLDVTTGTWRVAAPLPSSAYGPTAVKVGTGLALVHAYGDEAAYLYAMDDDSWTPVPVPSTSMSVSRATPIADGAVFVFSSVGGQFTTHTFRTRDAVWLAGPGGPPWPILGAIATLGNDVVVSVGGADYDFMGARAAAQ